MNKTPQFLFILAAALVQQSGLAAKTVAAAPRTETKVVTDRYFDVTVSDPYRWLESESDPAVSQWNTAQNSYARAYLDKIAARPALKEKLTKLIQAGSTRYSALTSAGSGIFAALFDPRLQQPVLVLLDANADPAGQRVILDPNKLDPSGLTAIDWYEASRDGKWVAVSLSKNGSEDGTLHIYEAATGKETADVIPRVQYPTAGGSLAWAPDGKGFWYTRYPGDEVKEADRHFFMQTYFHTLGTDWRKDPLVLGTADGLPRIAEIFLDNRYSKGVVLASVQKGDGGEWQQWLLRAGGSKVKVADFSDLVVAATLGPDDALYMVSLASAPNGKVLKLPAGGKSLAEAKP